MTRRRMRIAIALLWLAVLGSSLAVVYSRHDARSNFIELQKLTAQRYQLDIEWGQLQIEQSTGVWTVSQFQCGRSPSQAGYGSSPW